MHLGIDGEAGGSRKQDSNQKPQLGIMGPPYFGQGCCKHGKLNLHALLFRWKLSEAKAQWKPKGQMFLLQKSNVPPAPTASQ